jgi:adenine-specific DNA-methyltransferase
MNTARLGYRSWELGLGLLPVPLFFQRSDQPRHVLLNGTEGNFCLDEEVSLGLEERASIAWSSNVGHHIFVDSNVVEVTRWDKPLAAQKYTTSSIQSQLEAFHKHLQSDSPTSQASVVSHALGVYRAIRSGLRDGDQGSSALAAFLYLLACASGGAELGSAAPVTWALPTGARESFLSLKHGDQGFFLDRLTGKVGTSLLRPDFRLMLRHASGALFQEAHAQVILPEEDWLPGLGPLDAVIKANSVSFAEGAFFTPPSIARTLAEEALRELDVSATDAIQVFDPACGSGELLKEVLRLLETIGYAGAITLRGWDKSRAAVDIANFSLNWEAQSWNGRVQVHIEQVDSVLAPTWPRQSNVLVMNPPFRSWQQMTREEQDAVNAQLGDLQANKPNLASVFIRRAMHSLAQGGVLATVAPRSFFDSKSAEPLRAELADLLQARVVVNLANPAIYSYAMVQSGLFVGKRGLTQDATTLVWTDPQNSSVGEALRGLRRFQLGADAAINERNYSVYRDHRFSGRHSSWLPYSGWVLGRLLEEREGLVAAVRFTTSDRACAWGVTRFSSLPRSSTPSVITRGATSGRR